MEHLRDVAVVQGIQQCTKRIITLLDIIILFVVIVLFVVVVIVVVVIVLFVVVIFVVVVLFVVVIVFFVDLFFVLDRFVVTTGGRVFGLGFIRVFSDCVIFGRCFNLGRRFFVGRCITRCTFVFENGLQFGQIDASIAIGVDGFDETIDFRRWQCGQIKRKQTVFEFLGVDGFVVVDVKSAKDVHGRHLVVVHPCS